MYRLNSPPSSPLPPGHRFSLHPHALTLTPSQAAWYMEVMILPCIQCLSCVRHSAGGGVLFNSHNNLMRCIIASLHLILQKRRSRSQKSELACGGFPFGSGRAEMLARSAPGPLGGTALGLWPDAEDTGSGREIEGEILFLNKGLVCPSKPFISAPPPILPREWSPKEPVRKLEGGGGRVPGERR